MEKSKQDHGKPTMVAETRNEIHHHHHHHHHHQIVWSLRTLEPLWNFLATVVKEQTKVNRDVEVDDSQHVGPNDSAKTQCSFKVHQTIKE